MAQKYRARPLRSRYRQEYPRRHQLRRLWGWLLWFQGPGLVLQGMVRHRFHLGIHQKEVLPLPRLLLLCWALGRQCLVAGRTALQPHLDLLALLLVLHLQALGQGLRRSRDQVNVRQRALFC